MNEHVLATAEEIRAVYKRACDLLNRLEEEDADDGADDDDLGTGRRMEMYRRLGSAIEAFRFCAAAAAALRDPSLGDVVTGIMERIEPFENHVSGHHDVAADALAILLGAGLKVDGSIRELAESPSPAWREAVARGLRPNGGIERALLDKLLHDPVAAVRKAACKNLESVGETPWWSGKWKSDPAARLLPAEVEACGPALRRASELLDLQPYVLFVQHSKELAELCEQMAKLPDALAIEATEQLCRAAERYGVAALGPLVVPVLARPGGVDLFDRLVEHWGGRHDGILHRETIAGWVSETPREVRIAICQRCAARAVSAPASDRRGPRESPAWLASQVVGHAWPPDEDITPLLDVLLSVEAEADEEHAVDDACSGLGDALSLEGVDPAPVLDRLVEARLAGYPGAWRRFAGNADALLGRAPADVLRRTAEQALHSEDRGTAGWAIEQLLGPCHRPDTDGTRSERAAAFAADPRLRAILFASGTQVVQALPGLRLSLRRGELSYSEAVRVFEAISTLYGGLAFSTGLQRIHFYSFPGEEPVDPEKDRREAQAEHEDFLGPPELSGPPTEAEWDELRRLRDASPQEVKQESGRWLRTLSDGPWTGEERRALDRYVELFRAGQTDDLEHALGFALAVKPDVTLLPILDEIVKKCASRIRPMLQRARVRTYAILGVPRASAEAAASAKAEGAGELPGGEWDDDDGEDGEGEEDET